MTPKNGAAAGDDPLVLQPFRHISVSRLGCLLHVEFTGAKRFGAETLRELETDLLQLSGELPINSKVLIDFSDVEAFCPEAIHPIEELKKRLRNKGSRVALCCLGPNVLASFFPHEAAPKATVERQS